MNKLKVYSTDTVDAHITRAGIAGRAVDNTIGQHHREEVSLWLAVQLARSTYINGKINDSFVSHLSNLEEVKELNSSLEQATTCDSRLCMARGHSWNTALPDS